MSEYLDECNDCGCTGFKSDMTTFYKLTTDGPRVALVDGCRLAFFVRDIGLTPESSKNISFNRQLGLLEKASGFSVEEIRSRIKKMMEE